MARTRLRGLEIAGVQLGLEVPRSCEWEWPSLLLEDYRCLPRDPEVHVGVRVGEIDDVALDGECYALGAWTFDVARRGEDWILGLSRGSRREQVASFDRNFRSGEIVFSREAAERSPFPLRSPLDEWLVLHRLVAGGGLCLNGSVTPVPGGARIHLGLPPANRAKGWTTPTTTLLGRETVWVREVAGRLSVYRTPWTDASDHDTRAIGRVARVVDFAIYDESEQPYREVLDPSEAAEVLVTSSVVPVCDERLLERVLRNARRIADQGRVLRLGQARSVHAPIAWQSPQLQSGFAPPRGAV